MSSSLDYLELCRLCLVKDRVSVPIFEDEGDVRQIFLKITACLPVKVSREDKLPKKICDDCVYKVELFYQFWNTTANAEKQLLQWLGEVGGLEDKQGYVTEVLDTNVMKQERSSDSRLDGSVMQVGGHQNSMDMGMMDIITMPAGSEQQFTSVPMDTSGTVQTVQVVPGPSTQTTHDQMAQSQATHLGEESEEDNSDDGCDNEEGLPVKEEHEDDQGDQSLETTTFVALPCDEAGPSGLQQQKISEMSEMSMQQTADNDPKTGLSRRTKRRIINVEGNLIELEPKEEPKEEPVESYEHASNDLDFEEVTIDGSSSSFQTVVDSKDNPKVPKTHDKKSVSSPYKRKPAVYVCKTCDVSYSDHHSLARHFKLVHQNKAKKPEVEQKRTKSIIEKLQERAKGYSQTKDGKFACNYCDYKSVLTACVSAHISRSHKNHEQSIAVRTSSITLAIEPIVKDELNGKPNKEVLITDNEEQVVIEEEVPMLSEIDVATDELVEGDAEMVQEANQLLAHDDDYSMEEDNEAVGYGVHPYNTEDYGQHPDDAEDYGVYSEETENYGDQVGYEDLVEECEVEVDQTEEYIDDIEDSANYEGQDEYVEDYDAENEKTGDIDAHIEAESAEDQQTKKVPLLTYTCPYCDYATTNKAAIHQHITTEHNDVLTKKIRCTIESIQKSKEKQDKKRKRPGFKCMYCDFIGRTRTILYEHTRGKHPGNIQPAKLRKQPPDELKCDRCEFITTERRKMMMHIERKHTTEYRFTCEYCGKKFKVKCDLSSHIRFQHFKKPLVCDVCGKVCSNSNSLHVHQKREHYKPEFECQICHRRMVTQENLDEHILRQHEQRTTYMCEQCGKVFDQASKLKQHSMTHTGERPHTCHLCGKAFARRAVFRQHLLIHTGEKPYVCDICGKSFTQKPGLICHRKMHPGEKPPLPVVYIDHILKKIEKKIGD